MLKKKSASETNDLSAFPGHLYLSVLLTFELSESVRPAASSDSDSR